MQGTLAPFVVHHYRREKPFQEDSLVLSVTRFLERLASASRSREELHDRQQPQTTPSLYLQYTVNKTSK
jgi:hypothetical protein